MLHIGLEKTIYKDALAYLSFDYEDYSEKTNFVYNNYTTVNQCPSILNTGYCCTEADCHIGDIDSDCLLGRAGCLSSDLLISFWYNFPGFGSDTQFTSDDEVVVLKIGNLQMFVQYDTTVYQSPIEQAPNQMKGYIQWIDGTCKYSFPVPVMSWVHVSIFLKDNTMSLSFNDHSFANVDASCVLSSLTSSGSANGKFSVGYIIVDEFSLFELNDNVPNLYTTVITGYT